MNQKKIGLFIRELRTQGGMTQRQLAHQINISETAICKWETGVNLPDVSSLKALSNTFHVTVTELLNGGTSSS